MPAPSRLSEPPSVLPEASAGPTRPLTNATSAVSVVASPRRGSHLDRRNHPMYCRRPVQDTQDLNLSNNAPQPQPRFLHANDDLTSEIRYTARGRFMSCLPCTFVAPSLHSSAANQRSNLAQVLPTRFTLSPPPTSTSSLPMASRNLCLRAVCADHRCDGYGFNVSNKNGCASPVNSCH